MERDGNGIFECFLFPEERQKMSRKAVLFFSFSFSFFYRVLFADWNRGGVRGDAEVVIGCFLSALWVFLLELRRMESNGVLDFCCF